MPTFQVLTPPSTEPVSLIQVNSWCRLDLSADVLAAAEATGPVPSTLDAALVADAQNLALLRTAARQKVEAYTGRYFSEQTVAITYFVYEPYVLPAGAEALSVDGFFTDLTALANRSSYLEEYRKSISINRELPFGEALQQTYTVTAKVKSDPQYSALASTVIMKFTADMYKNRELAQELSVEYKVLLAEARTNVLGAD